ncbi:sugar ABC transporter substrate-binding protein [Pseudonocardia sp. MH-G8]|uniref:ABC transporter substrate-binding protein n=1 Tax=Pseudonocardia sp. MH-G8 TaxID=1854588 RepID=UPI0013044491|nr:sugar ABC transporter substrate-binding protein [Pseudonocardia sp. MH-G8]
MGRQVSRRTLLRGAAGLAGAATLAGCGGGGDPTALRFWQFYSPGGGKPLQSKWFTDLVDAWNAENSPRVELEFVPNSQYVDGPKLQTSFSAGKGPDLFVVSPGDFLRYYNGGVLADLTPYLTEEARADFYPELLESRSVDGRVHALPMGGGPLAMYYSVPAFEAAGLAEGDLPRTWDQLLDVGERLTTREGFGAVFETAPGYFQNFTFYPYLWMAGGGLPGLVDEPGRFDSNGTVAALQLFQDLVSRGVVPRTPGGGGASDLVGNLGSGYCAMQYAGMWGVADLRRGKPDLEYGVLPLPLPPGGSSVTATGGWAFAANAQGRDPDAAARFCAWALGSMDAACVERVARWCVEAQSYLPYRRSAMRRAEELGAFEDAKLRTFRDTIFPGARGEPRLPPELNKAVSDVLQACQLNGADPSREVERAGAIFASALEGYAGAPLV